MSKNPVKICANCEKEKPATPEFFHRQRDVNRSFGLTSWCKKCRNRRKRQNWADNKPDHSLIYFVQGADLIKIGRTYNLDDRMTKLQCGSPVPLTLLGTVQGEKKAELNLHQLFDHLRQHGEWFKAEQSLLDFINAATA